MQWVASHFLNNHDWRHILWSWKRCYSVSEGSDYWPAGGWAPSKQTVPMSKSTFWPSQAFSHLDFKQLDSEKRMFRDILGRPIAPSLLWFLPQHAINPTHHACRSFLTLRLICKSPTFLLLFSPVKSPSSKETNFRCLNAGRHSFGHYRAFDHRWGLGPVNR